MWLKISLLEGSAKTQAEYTWILRQKKSRNTPSNPEELDKMVADVQATNLSILVRQNHSLKNISIQK